MRDYLPVSMTKRVQQMTFPLPFKSKNPLLLEDRRLFKTEKFNPSYHAERFGKVIPVRIKPDRLFRNILEYGDFTIDMTRLSALVDYDQVLTIGYALLFAQDRFRSEGFSPSELSRKIDFLIDTEGLDILINKSNRILFLARPRLQELAGAINRMRNCKIGYRSSQ